MSLRTTRFFILAAITLSASMAAPADAAQSPPVTVSEQKGRVVLDNGLLTLTVSSQNGDITSIRHKHLGRDIELTDGKKGMYLDANGGPDEPPADAQTTEPKAGYEGPLSGGKFSVVQSGPDAAEVQIVGHPSTWFPFAAEAHYILPRGQSGYYAYVIYRHGPGMAAGSIGQTRFAFKGAKADSVFTNHVVDDRRMGLVPTSKVVATVQDATYRLADGTIYTKYDNSLFTHDYLAYGMAGHGTGLWVTWPSTEFLNGGPLRQDLTVHTENALLVMFQGGHFGAGEISVKQDETWTKLFGPVFIYANNAPSVKAMFEDAKERAYAEQKQWPYSWLHNADYPLERGTVSGRVNLTNGTSVKNAWVVLAPPGDIDWTQSANGYMFWTKTDADGRFSVPKVRPGRYTLFVSGANQFEDFKRENVDVSTTAVDLGDLKWMPVTHGRTLWQIGIADRSSAEFKDGDNFRHYGNFLRYPKAFPDDVTFVIGKSKESTDWNFAQWGWYSRKPFWTVQFPLQSAPGGKATLTIGLASAETTGLQVKVNGQEVTVLHPKKSGAAGYRSGGQDSNYTVAYVTFDATLLKSGNNEITLGHTRTAPFSAPADKLKKASGEVMYDAIRLEVEPLMNVRE